MKVREIYPCFANAHEVHLAFGSALYTEDLTDPVIMSAFGDFNVREVNLFAVDNACPLTHGQVDVELHLDMAPIREVAR